MGCERYLAMTAEEFAATTVPPAHMAWMACHFSPYGRGLCNLPRQLPEGSVLILNDRISWNAHDAALITRQLSDAAIRQKASAVLLDFENADVAGIDSLIRKLKEALPCPLVVSKIYAPKEDIAVFLPPCPIHVPLQKYLLPWEGRPIWLEAAVQTEVITVTEKGSKSCVSGAYDMEECPHEDHSLHCCYRIEAKDNAAHFILRRDRSHIDALQEEASALGVAAIVGLHQELG